MRCGRLSSDTAAMEVYENIMFEIQAGAAFCILPDLAGLDAIVRAEDISSAGPADPRDRVKVGDVIKGRSVTDIIPKSNTTRRPSMEQMSVLRTPRPRQGLRRHQGRVRH